MAFGKLLSELTPITIQGTTSYPIYVIDMSAYNVASIDSVMLNTTTNVLGILTSTAATDLSTIYEDYANGDISTDGIEWSLDNQQLTIYTKITSTDDQDYRLVLTGTRRPNTIGALDETLDVPPEDLELFISYAIREAAQLLGKVVPPVVEQNILELEGE